ncbi:MAG: ankyrin repeat domain-containing protein [Elusimicrobiota bacterium]|jgi:ankyrin repeat protein|nr:ankyrin repeat domain-containing protein [Elusimicrobiota bacterium]
MKYFVLPLIICALFTAACAKKDKKPDVWHKNAGFIKSVQLSDDLGAAGIITTTDIDLNSPDEEGRTALHYAVETSANEKLISAIANSGRVNLTALDNQGYDALSRAAESNYNEEVFLALLIAGARPQDAERLLDTAYKNTNVKVPSMAGRLIIKTPWDKAQSFLDALKSGDLETLRRELPFTDIQNPSAPQQSAPLYLAIAGLNHDIVSELIKAGEDVNELIIPAQKVTPLLYAAASRPPLIVDALIKNGADVNAQDSAGQTPLMVAARLHPESVKIINLLLKNKADIKITDNNGDTALHLAARGNETPDNISVLLKAGADINAKNKFGDSPLHLAAAYNKNEIITETLLKEHAEAAAPNNAGLAPIMLAAEQNANEKLITIIAAFAPDVNAKNPQGLTPLMMAAAGNQNEKVLTALIEAGAETGDIKQLQEYAAKNKSEAVKKYMDKLAEERNPVPAARQDAAKPQNSKSKKVWYNNKAFSDAVEKGDVKALRMALGGGVNIHVMLKGSRSITALMYAAAHTQAEEIINILIKAGADVNAVNEAGDTALLVAALAAKNPAIIDALVQAGANVNAKDYGGITPLLTAAANNPEPEIINALIKNGADTSNIGELLEAASKNKNPAVKDLIQRLH